MAHLKVGVAGAVQELALSIDVLEPWGRVRNWDSMLERVISRVIITVKPIACDTESPLKSLKGCCVVPRGVIVSFSSGIGLEATGSCWRIVGIVNKHHRLCG